MDIYFINKRIEKQFNVTKNELLKIHGEKRAKLISVRMERFRAAETLFDLHPPKSPPARCHELTHGDRKEQLSVDLDHPYRLIFTPKFPEKVKREDGGLDWKKVNAITIVEIADTH